MSAIRCFGWVMLGAMLVAGTSCERVRRAVEKARENGRKAAAGGAGSGASREDLGKLVDRNDEGWRFRHDLPFPGHVRCVAERKLTFTKGRRFIQSAFGELSSPFKEILETVLVVERDGAIVSVEMKRNRNLPISPEPEAASGEAGKEPKKDAENASSGDASGDAAGEGAEELPDSLEGMELRFIHRADGWHWSRKGSDFREMAAGKEMEPAIGENLPQWGLIPRSPWFGDRRFSPGTEVQLVGKQIELITGTHVKRGKATLRFEKTETLDGHPCAVFAWSGDYAEETISLEGEYQHYETSVKEGRIWCSLIYPVVLRSEEKGMITVIMRDSKKKLKLRLQGAFEVSKSCQWNSLANE